MDTKTKAMMISVIASVAVVIGIMIYLVYDITVHEPEKEDTTSAQTTERPLADSSNDSTTEDIGKSDIHTPSYEPGIDNHKYVIVGDSRYVAMESMKGENDTFICDNGVGRYFLIENMDRIITAASEDNSRIVIGLGVNDVNCADEYIELLTELNGKTDAEIFYVLVNPVDEGLCRANGYSITNDSIDNFNIAVTNGIINEGIRIIDINSVLKDAGYSCTDGLHYTTETYSTIFHYLKTSLSNYK